MGSRSNGLPTPRTSCRTGFLSSTAHHTTKGTYVCPWNFKDRRLPLALGGNTFGWTSDEPTSLAVLDAFVAGGGNFIDTADGYSAWAPGNSGGESETIIGTWMASRRNRADVVIGTKVSQHPEFRGLAASNVRAAADASLQRLRTDYIDVYYAHFDDDSVPLEETVEAFDGLRTAGKIREVGVSNYSPERLQEWIDIAIRRGFALPVALQPHYNLVKRTATRPGSHRSSRHMALESCRTSPSRAGSSPASTGPRLTSGRIA